jgi:hypothetical protein
VEQTFEQKYKALQEKHILTKEYLRRALLKLKNSIDFFDVEIDDSDEEEDRINKFISEVKRKNLI